MRSFFIALIALMSLGAYSQNDSCLNIGFENGQFNGWQAFLGDASGNSNQLINLAPDTSNLFHSIHTVGFDNLIPTLPKVSPVGGSYSAMIGDSSITGMRGGMLRQSFIVNATTPYFVYHNAIVLENAAHTENESPYFTAKIFDVNSTEIYSYGINAANISSGLDPDFIIQGNYFYRQWETSVVDLSAYVGQAVTVEFSAVDCFQGGHAGYAYVDADCFASTNCSLLNIDFVNVSNVECSASGNIGAQISYGYPPYSYLWSTGDTSSAIQPDSAGIFGLTVTDGNGCTKSKSVLLNGSPHPTGYDLEANLNAFGFRPGQTTRVDINAVNNGCVPISGVLKMVYDTSLISLHSIVPTPLYVNGDTVVWNTPIMSYDSTQFSPTLYVVADTAATVGMTACFKLIILPTASDSDTLNNIKNYCFPILNSYDPNYKQVYPVGECTPNYVLKDHSLIYTVHFQNTGMAPAININIVDTLSSNLNINSVKIIGKSHDSLVTEVLSSNVLNFKFNDIQLLHSLANEPASHGFVIFSVDAIDTVSEFTETNNKVDIYFDYNPPITTNSVYNTFVSSIPHQQTVLNESVVGSYDLNGIVYDSTGTYYQYFQTVDGCDSTVVLNLVIMPTGISENSNSRFIISPNPNAGEFTMKISNNGVQYTFAIFDIAGKLIHSESSNKSILSVDLNNTSAGIYFVKISSANFNLNSKLIVK